MTGPNPAAWPVGKLVQLKSGGPAMVISQSVTFNTQEKDVALWTGYAVECTWLDVYHFKQTAWFDPALLQRPADSAVMAHTRRVMHRVALMRTHMGALIPGRWLDYALDILRNP